MEAKLEYFSGGGFKLKNIPWERDGYFLEQRDTAVAIIKAVFN